MGKYHQPTSGSWGTQPRFVLHRSSPKVCTSGGARCSSQGGETNNTEGTIHCNCCITSYTRHWRSFWQKKRVSSMKWVCTDRNPLVVPLNMILINIDIHTNTYKIWKNHKRFTLFRTYPCLQRNVTGIRLFLSRANMRTKITRKSWPEAKTEASSKLQIVNVRSFWVAP